MKKRLIALMTAACLVCTPVSVLAEEFSLRNDIHFGESMEDVKAKEKFTLDGEDEGDETDTLSYDDETVSGIDNTDLVYLFNDDGLYEMYYRFEERSIKDLMIANYDTLYDGLVRKYGDPLPYSDGSSYIITTEIFDLSTFMYMLYDMGGKWGDYVKYNEWVVESDDYNVKIDLLGYYMGNSYDELEYSLVLGYRKFTDEQLKEAQDEKQNKQDTVDSDL